jgi:hypothetical protein
MKYFSIFILILFTANGAFSNELKKQKFSNPPISKWLNTIKESRSVSKKDHSKKIVIKKSVKK